MKYFLNIIIVLLSGTPLFPGTQSTEPLNGRHNLGINYGTNFFGNIGRIDYSYDFSELASFRVSTGMGYLSLNQELASYFGRVSFNQDINRTEVRIFVQQVSDIGLTLHFYRIKNINFFRNLHMSLSHIFFNFEHKYFDTALQGTYTGRKNFSLWGGTLGTDIFEHQISPNWRWSIGTRLTVFFMPTPQEMLYNDGRGNQTSLDLSSSSGEASTWLLFYPELYLSFTRNW